MPLVHARLLVHACFTPIDESPRMLPTDWLYLLQSRCQAKVQAMPSESTSTA